MEKKANHPATQRGPSPLQCVPWQKIPPKSQNTFRYSQNQRKRNPKHLTPTNLSQTKSSHNDREENKKRKETILSEPPKEI